MVKPRDIAGECRRRRRMVNPRDIARECRRRRRMVNPRDIARERRRRRRMVNPRDIAGERRRRRRRRSNSPLCPFPPTATQSSTYSIQTCPVLCKTQRNMSEV